MKKAWLWYGLLAYAWLQDKLVSIYFAVNYAKELTQGGGHAEAAIADLTNVLLLPSVRRLVIIELLLSHASVGTSRIGAAEWLICTGILSVRGRCQQKGPNIVCMDFLKVRMEPRNTYTQNANTDDGPNGSWCQKTCHNQPICTGSLLNLVA